MQELLSCTFARSLEKLYLRSNAIGDSSALALAGMLPVLKLQALSLAGNRIKNHGAAAFAFALDQTQTLAILDLEHNQVCTVGLRIFDLRKRSLMESNEVIRSTTRDCCCLCMCSWVWQPPSHSDISI